MQGVYLTYCPWHVMKGRVPEIADPFLSNQNKLPKDLSCWNADMCEGLHALRPGRYFYAPGVQTPPVPGACRGPRVVNTDGYCLERTVNQAQPANCWGHSKLGGDAGWGPQRTGARRALQGNRSVSYTTYEPRVLVSLCPWGRST